MFLLGPLFLLPMISLISSSFPLLSLFFFFFLMIRRPPRSTLFPYPTLSRSGSAAAGLPVKGLPIHDTGCAEARRLARALAAQQSDVLVAEPPRDVRLGALASFARRFALVYSYNVNRAVPPRDPIMRLAYRRVRLTIFRTHTGEREVLASAPFMGRPPHRVIHEGVDVALFRPDPQAGRAFRARHGLGDRPFLLAVGALEREKRYDWILDALARLGPRPPPPPPPPPPPVPGHRPPPSGAAGPGQRPGLGRTPARLPAGGRAPRPGEHL